LYPSYVKDPYLHELEEEQSDSPEEQDGPEEQDVPQEQDVPEEQDGVEEQERSDVLEEQEGVPLIRNRAPRSRLSGQEKQTNRNKYMRNYMAKYRQQQKEQISNPTIGIIADTRMFTLTRDDIDKILNTITNLYANIFQAYPGRDQYKEQETLDNMLKVITEFVRDSITGHIRS
jgi:hypothetical protein